VLPESSFLPSLKNARLETAKPCRKRAEPKRISAPGGMASPGDRASPLAVAALVGWLRRWESAGLKGRDSIRNRKTTSQK